MKKKVQKLTNLIAVSLILTACYTSKKEDYQSHPLVHYYKTSIPENEEEKVKILIDSVLKHEKDDYILSVAWYMNGRYHYRNKRNENAFRSWLESLDQYRQTKVEDNYLAVNLYKNIGSIFYFDKNYKKAISNYEKSLTIAENKGMIKEVLNLKYNIGSTLAKDLSNTVPTIFYDALQEAERQKDNKKIVQIRMKLGNCLTALGELDEAESQLYNAYRIAQNDKDLFKYEIKVGQNLGHCLSSSMKYEEALAIYKEIYIKKPLMSTAIDIGEIYLISGDTGKAVSQWKIAESMYKDQRRTPEYYKVYDFLARYDQSNQLHYSNRYREEDIAFEQESKNIDQLTKDSFYLSYETNKDQEAANRKYKAFQNLILALLALVILVFVFVELYRWVEVIKSKRLIKEKEKKIEQTRKFLSEVDLIIPESNNK